MGGGTGTSTFRPNYEAAIRLLDREAADILVLHGLLRPEPIQLPPPSVWKLTVRAGKGKPRMEAGMLREVRDIVYTVLGNHHYWTYGSKPRTHFEKLYYRESPAKAQLTIATRGGLDATLEPCIVVPLKDWS